MAGARTNGGVPALGWWLIVVGAFRSGYTWSCFFGSAAFCSATFSEIEGTCCRSISRSSNTLQMNLR
jgi:hypothetical protein